MIKIWNLKKQEQKNTKCIVVCNVWQVKINLLKLQEGTQLLLHPAIIPIFIVIAINNNIFFVYLRIQRLAANWRWLRRCCRLQYIAQSIHKWLKMFLKHGRRGGKVKGKHLGGNCTHIVADVMLSIVSVPRCGGRRGIVRLCCVLRHLTRRLHRSRVAV